MNQRKDQREEDRDGAPEDAPLSRRTRKGRLAFAVYLYRHTPTFRGFVDFAIIGAIVYAFLHPPTLANLSPLGAVHDVIDRVPTKISDICDLDFINCKNAQMPLLPYTFSDVRAQLHAAIEASKARKAERAPARFGGDEKDARGRSQDATVPGKRGPSLGQVVKHVQGDRKQFPKAPTVREKRIDRSLFESSSSQDQRRLHLAADAFERKDAPQTLVHLDGADPQDPNVVLMRGLGTLGLPGVETRKAGMRLLLQAVAHGQRQSISFLGTFMLQPAMGVEANPEQGRHLLETAARMGDVSAARLVGTAYLSGWGGAVDYPKAAEFLGMAVEAGDAEAAYHLSILALKGMGMAKDEAEALRLLEVSAKGGVRDSQEALGMYYLIQYGAGWLQSPAPAVEWLSRAAEAGSPFAMRYLASFHLTIGKGPQWHDPAKTADYFQRCAAMWYPPCLFGYAAVNHHGLGVKRDLVAAHAYYALSLPGGQIKAKKRLAELEEILNAEQLDDARALAEELEAQRASAPPLDSR